MPEAPEDEQRTRVCRECLVDIELAGERLDKAAARLFSDFSRSVLTRWINSGELRVDAAQVKPRYRLQGGERLVIDARLGRQENWQAGQAVAFEVVFEDEDLLVVNKPAGLVVHPGAGNPDHTLVNGLLLHRPALASLPRAGIIHRLDKDTSGLLIVAASVRAHTRLVRDLQSRAIERRYLAVAEGRMVSGRDIDAPIGRDARQRTRQQVRDDGKPSLTRVRVQERFRIHTLIEAQLATGRTHQIRVHLSSIGYPLVGDRRYGARGKLPPAADQNLIELLRSFPRQALHAWKLNLQHPLSDETLAFCAPLPEDLDRLNEALRADARAVAPPGSNA